VLAEAKKRMHVHAETFDVALTRAVKEANSKRLAGNDPELLAEEGKALLGLGAREGTNRTCPDSRRLAETKNRRAKFLKRLGSAGSDAADRACELQI
jgi:hypothetical protein